MKKIMISQPMKDKSYKQIYDERRPIIDKLSEDENVEVVNSLFHTNDYKLGFYFTTREIIHEDIAMLSRAIQVLSLCDAIYMMKGWENACGCKIEHEIAKQYGLEIIYEE